MLYLFLRRSNAPGQQECDSVMDMLKDQIVSVDQALVGAISRTLKPIKEVTLEVSHWLADFLVRVGVRVCVFLLMCVL